MSKNGKNGKPGTGAKHTNLTADLATPHKPHHVKTASLADILGFTPTTTLGVLEAAIGLCLLLRGAARSRTGEVFFGAILGIAAFVGAVQADSFRKSLALESGWAWLMVFAAVIVVLAALVMPRFARHSTTIANI